jgi:hypothetical protein
MAFPALTSGRGIRLRKSTHRYPLQVNNLSYLSLTLFNNHSTTSYLTAAVGAITAAEASSATQYRLQSHKENYLFVAGIERLGDHSIHRMAHRIIKRSPGDGRARLPAVGMATAGLTGLLATAGSVAFPPLAPVLIPAAIASTTAMAASAERWFEIKRGDDLELLQDIFGRL